MVSKPLSHLVWIALLWGALTGYWAAVVAAFVVAFVVVLLVCILFD